MWASGSDTVNHRAGKEIHVNTTTARPDAELQPQGMCLVVDPWELRPRAVCVCVHVGGGDKGWRQTL